MRKGKVKPWRGYEFLHENGDDVVIDNHYKKNCTVYPDGCDPTPAAARKLIKAAMMLNAIPGGLYSDFKAALIELDKAVAAYRKSTTPKKRKPGVREA